MSNKEKINKYTGQRNSVCFPSRIRHTFSSKTPMPALKSTQLPNQWLQEVQSLGKSEWCVKMTTYVIQQKGKGRRVRYHEATASALEARGCQ